MSGNSEVSEDAEGGEQGRADGRSDCAGRTTCAVFGGASELGRPGASIGSAFAEPIDAFLGMFPAHVYESAAMLSQMVANANQERGGQLHLTYGRLGPISGWKSKKKNDQGRLKG